MSRAFSTALLSLGLSTSFVVTSASAHISLERGGTHKSRYGDGQTSLKDPPCGVAGGTRGPNVYTYAPGQTIDVSIVEYIPHPSYFRIAFDDDGDDGFVDPASIDPIDPTRACPDSNPGDHCGPSAYYNSPAVLPGMDELNPHIPAAADLLNPPKYTWQVTLPNRECQNCTLQIIQVMEDDAFHGAYDPTPGVGIPDIYHQCIDLVLTAGAATGAGGTSSAGNGGATGASGASGAGSSVGGSPGGSGTGGGVGLGGSGTVGTAGGAGSSGAAPGAASSGDTGGCSVSGPRSGSPGHAAWIAAALGLSAVGRRRRRS